jgi:crotonobetainyl-CoA:carnitine CoA-transferase CaiB-like acyl-CoA transferase
MKPLHGIKILDFGTLLPAPLATLLLAEAGAEVIKIERPGRGDEMRSYTPKFGVDSINFALLNRGKRSLAVDLKADGAVELLTPLIREADIIIEQFRAGVMDRLGLSYDALAAINPRLIYASITGYGQSGPYADVAAHDLNFCAQSGMLSLAAGSDGAPVVPSALVADIAGGAYPAVINILLALRKRDQTGRGCKLDIAMADNLFTLLYWSLGNGLAAGQWPRPAGDLVTGGSPRYNIYRAADGRFIAAAPLEDKFWDNFCAAIGLGHDERDDSRDPEGVKQAVARRIALRSSDDWRSIFAGQDVCCNIVATLDEAIDDRHFRARGVFDWTIEAGGRILSALPVPIDSQFRDAPSSSTYPALGGDNTALLTEPS